MTPLAKKLEHIGKKPEMWFGRGGELRSLIPVEAFLTGYEHGLTEPDHSLSFSHFTRWIAAHYKVNDGAMNGFSLIREHVGGDERLAFDEFFKLLPAYIRDMEELGPETIHARYSEVMSRIREKRQT